MTFLQRTLVIVRKKGSYDKIKYKKATLKENSG